MKSTIDAMKQIHAVLEGGDLLCEVTAASMLFTLIKREEAQTVEPPKNDEFRLREELASTLSCWHRLTGKESGELVSFFATHPAQASSGEREALIAESPEINQFDYTDEEVVALNEWCIRAYALLSSDMLAADAQEPVTCGHGCDCLTPCAEYYKHAGAPKSAQQVAVPQGWKPIATAPKDGTMFRAYADDLIDLDFNPQGSVECAWDGECFVGCVWNGQQDAWYGKPVAPTYWMPIPIAPQGETL